MAICKLALHQHEWPFTAKDQNRQKMRWRSDDAILYSIAFAVAGMRLFGEGRLILKQVLSIMVERAGF